MKLTLDDLGNIGEIIAGLGVVVSLFYVGFQIKQNTRASRASSVLATRQMSNEFHHILTRPGMAEIYIRGLSSYPDLEEGDRARFQSLMNTQFSYYESLYFNQLDVENRELTRRRRMPKYVVSPSSTWWKQMGSLHRPEFVEWLNNLANNNETADAT